MNAECSRALAIELTVGKRDELIAWRGVLSHEVW
jgi:hypothetical protein